MPDGELMLLGTQRVNDDGHLEVGGCDTVELVEEFGTPLYVMDETHLRQQCREYRGSFAERLTAATICFASKALTTTAICRIIDQESLSLEVSSAGELYTAIQAGFPPERILLHGNFKLDQELPPEVARVRARAYALMGLIDEDLDLRELLLSVSLHVV